MALYICPTPIGNLEDITLRVLRILKEVDYIAAEDTRNTRKLLSHYDIHTPLISYHEHNKGRRGEDILAMCKRGKDVALVSDAGTPGISDPGWELIRDAIAAEVEVICLPGPTALITALVASGFQTSSFIFEGFLPRRKKERRKFLEEFQGERRTLIFYEAPHRLLHALTDMLEVLGDRRISIARELTKVHEEVLRGTISQVMMKFSENPPRGEMVIVVEGIEELKEGFTDGVPLDAPEGEEDRDKGFDGTPPGLEARGNIEITALVRRVDELVEKGMSVRDAVKEVARELDLPRREVYNAYHERIHFIMNLKRY